jgi:hypothetical protein
MDRATAYDEDIYAWSQEQAAALRRLAQTRRDLPNDLDLEHVAEEIEDVGSSELRRVESFLELLLQHLVKLVSAPEAPARRHWAKEIDLQREVLRHDLKNSMRQTIDLDRIWRAAKARADAALDQHGDAIVPGLPERCPFSLDELIAEPFDVAYALARLRTSPLSDS